MANRKNISKKIRFEVFKRDSFTCQYCGRTSPDVVLHVDHITPVSKGGENELLNLVTSCVDCNLGKSDTQLDDKSALNKQLTQLKELNEKREQLSMMLEWRNGLKSIKEEAAKVIKEAINEVLRPFNSELNDTGITTVAKWLKKYSVQEILDAIDISADKFLLGKKEEADTVAFFEFTPKIMEQKRLPVLTQRLNYARGILRRRIYLNQNGESSCINMMTGAIANGADIEEIIYEIKRINHWNEFEDLIGRWY